MVLEEMFSGIWKDTNEDRQNWLIAQFDVVKETRSRLWNLALIIKYFKRPLEKILSDDETDKIFLTVEALFWYHLDFYQALIEAIQPKEKKIAGLICHFVEASSLDHAIFFTSYPGNMEYFESLVLHRPALAPYIEVCQARMLNVVVEEIEGTENTLGKHMGHFYRRFQQLKNQIGALISFGPESSEKERLADALVLVGKFESACGKIMESRTDLIALFDAISRADHSHIKDEDKKIFSPLEVCFDRSYSLDKTIHQMQLNAKVRYNQAVFIVDYRPNKPGKPTSITITTKQVSVSIFSRYVALLEIVFPKKKAFRKQRTDIWTYKLLYPIVPLSHVNLHSVPETDRSQHMVEMRIVLGEEKKHLLVFRCEDVKHKRDLIQQFRLIQFEACPKDPLRGFNWQVVSSIRKTKSDCELQQAEDAHQYAQFATHQCPSGSQKSRPDDLIKICQAPENPTIFLGVPKPANTEDSSLVGCAAENAQMSNIEAGVERACEAL